MRTPNPDLDLAAIQSDWSGKPAADSGTIHQTLRCTLVTPLFGGGVEAGQVDLEQPVRGTSIRGQLRYWWRIACGPFDSDADMFKREAAIWGGIASKGPKASKVRLRSIGKALTQNDLTKSSSEKDPGIKYAYGPSAIDGDALWLRPGYQFELHLSYPRSIDDEVELALRWWASFGGLGARTRRGFGAVKVDGLSPVTASEVEARNGQLAFTGRAQADAGKAWRASVGKLFRYRQGPGMGRRTGSGNRPGRSYWPEADQLRRFTGKHASNHEPRHEAGNVFPRAAFGLPIMFEFKGSERSGDPAKTELLPAGEGDRMASPLILRPYPEDKGWRAAALLLPGWQAALDQRLRMKQEQGQGPKKHMVEQPDFHPAHWPKDPAKRQQTSALIPPMTANGQNRADDPLSAFMHYFEQ